MAEFVQGLDKVFTRAKRLQLDVRQLDKPVKKSGKIMLDSIRQNFATGGRPRWTPLAASTQKRKRGGGILIGKTKKLSGGFKPVQNGNSVSVENSVVYGPRHNFGYKGGKGRGRSATPARPFVMFQPEDITNIGSVFCQHISSGAGK